MHEIIRRGASAKRVLKEQRSAEWKRGSKKKIPARLPRKSEGGPTYPRTIDILWGATIKNQALEGNLNGGPLELLKCLWLSVQEKKLFLPTKRIKKRRRQKSSRRFRRQS